MTHAPYPSDCYIVHRWFDGPIDMWGDIGGGPVATAEDVRHAILESFRDDYYPAWPANLTTVRVWRLQHDVPARDVTEDILRAIGEDLSEKLRRGFISEIPWPFVDWAKTDDDY